MEHRFDELARGLAHGVTRRETLRLLGAGLATGMLSAVGLGGGVAEAGTCNPGQACGQKPLCFCIRRRRGGNFCACNALCVNLQHCRRSSQCPEGWTCAQTQCPGGKVCNPPCGGADICRTSQAGEATSGRR